MQNDALIRLVLVYAGSYKFSQNFEHILKQNTVEDTKINKLSSVI